MSEITANNGQSFARVSIISLNSPESEIFPQTFAFRPGLEAHRKLLVTFFVANEKVSVEFELRDEIFETETIRGENKYKEAEEGNE